MAFGETQEAAVDLTLVFDPAEVWPDPLSCPDWPLGILETRQGERIMGERAAMQQLETLIRTLARTSNVREPTAAEREKAFATYFRRLDDPNVGGWRGIIHGIAPLNHVVETPARLIVEGLHIRGYLRKLKAADVAAQERKALEAHQRMMHAYEAYPAAAERLLAELSGLREAEERQRQREADERAVNRAHEIRSSLRDMHSSAMRAANACGLDGYPPPQID